MFLPENSTEIKTQKAHSNVNPTNCMDPFGEKKDVQNEYSDFLYHTTKLNSNSPYWKNENYFRTIADLIVLNRGETKKRSAKLSSLSSNFHATQAGKCSGCNLVSNLEPFAPKAETLPLGYRGLDLAQN
ncbi:hypothetical protein AVEN_122500-1 [Araneus ventricosus]|uniref:Uncharacterized protein n=1 Tax=Araneus ventricosus TaxID=182803 RepID=A0A4Y2MQG6_ARAVE|nr:hypothetical protein AVEN_122500-1 [Araneus ventricosus]